MAILFDLDGTLLDTAPDFHWAINRLRKDMGLPSIGLGKVRPWVSMGSLSILQACLEPPFPKDLASIREDYLALYQASNFANSVEFPGINELLQAIESANIPWGIVTNKPDWLTQPLIAKFNYQRRAKVVVSGDTLSEAKPSAMPLLYAMDKIKAEAQQCVYVGDALRDIQAGQAANVIATIAASYGYINNLEPIDTWNATHVANDVAELTKYLQLYFPLLIPSC